MFERPARQRHPLLSRCGGIVRYFRVQGTAGYVCAAECGSILLAARFFLLFFVASVTFLRVRSDGPSHARAALCVGLGLFSPFYLLQQLSLTSSLKQFVAETQVVGCSSTRFR